MNVKSVDSKSIAVLTIFPEMLSALTDFGISSKAVEKELVHIRCFNPRTMTLNFCLQSTYNVKSKDLVNEPVLLRATADGRCEK